MKKLKKYSVKKLIKQPIIESWNYYQIFFIMKFYYSKVNSQTVTLHCTRETKKLQDIQCIQDSVTVTNT